ncbi:hypothetical protein [Bacteriovorax sp. DB6_IX]|uniref:hypothetical protein n=1 Tax=Bacteriovorax sp. DB6_IX TaxID=1353530 RepID=UPI00038A083A|nr:hypothetical protein [Bacteriovorax sp. DB6_IX]EQC48736.1 hypothetical protein M901_0089 [Bacteriovorax sp. DB6_IX]
MKEKVGIMYCPKCMNNSLHVNSRGVMHIIVNGKQMDAGRFLYHLDDSEVQFYNDLSAKLEEFFKWYSGFQNVESITKVEIATSDVSCDNKCRLPLNNKFSVVDNVIPVKKLKEILENLGTKYKLSIEIVV